jgi:hypothetical protein
VRILPIAVVHKKKAMRRGAITFQILFQGNEPCLPKKIYDIRLDYFVLEVFGCARLPYKRPYNKHNVDFRSTQCKFLGYNLSHKVYRCVHGPLSCLCL